MRPSTAAPALRRPSVGEPLPRSFYRRDAVVVAPELLNALLVAGARVGRIVEVEAYRGAEDPASHAYRGPTRRNATMFGPPGHLYVYRSYGLHWCANVVCGDEGVAMAVLLRALAPVAGVDEMRAARGTSAKGAPASRPRPLRELASGPGKLGQAMGIGPEHDGADLVEADRGLAVWRDGVPAPDDPGVGPRVGLRLAADYPWRWWVRGDPNLSRPG